MPAESNAIGGTVQAIEYQGAYVKVTMQRPEHEDFVAHVADSDFFTQHLDIGDRVVARAAEDVHLLETAQDHKPARRIWPLHDAVAALPVRIKSCCRSGL